MKKNPTPRTAAGPVLAFRNDRRPPAVRQPAIARLAAELHAIDAVAAAEVEELLRYLIAVATRLGLRPGGAR